MEIVDFCIIKKIFETKDEFMKIIFITFIFGLFSVSLFSQSDHIPNSFKKRYDSLFPALKYSYDPATQTHDYSGNWDFDGDKKLDSLFFIGNGGAHLYFHLRLKLSSEDIIRDFRYLVSDFPILDSISRLKRMYGENSNFPIFVVHDFNSDGKMEVYLNTDINFVPIPSKWKKRGVTSRSLLISYQMKDIVIKNFPGITGIN